MAVVRAEDIYERHIKLLPVVERLRLLAIIAQNLAAELAQSPKPLPGEDVQTWVSRTRREADQHREQVRNPAP